MRKHWIDNLRWVTVLLVLLYHVVYFYNNKGVFGGIGGFGDGPQYQDVIMYILYPWFMPLLFILAGISARYALEKHPAKEWFRSRTRKLLVPSTIGLFFFGVFIGWFNALSAPTDGFSELPLPVKYFIWVISGTGPLWFIQDLWLLSLILLIIRRLDSNDRFYNLCGKTGIIGLILMGILFWLGEKTLIMEPDPMGPGGLINLYKPVFYAIPFVMGYFIFSHERIQDMLGHAWKALMICAACAGILLIIRTFGENNTLPQYLCSPLNNIYGWLACLSMMGWFRSHFDYTGKFGSYMTQSSYGIYIVHYLVIVSIGTLLKSQTTLQPIWIYLLLTLSVFMISPLLYEVLRRIPFIRWAVLGEKRK